MVNYPLFVGIKRHLKIGLNHAATGGKRMSDNWLALTLCSLKKLTSLESLIKFNLLTPEQIFFEKQQEIQDMYTFRYLGWTYKRIGLLFQKSPANIYLHMKRKKSYIKEG